MPPAGQQSESEPPHPVKAPEAEKPLKKRDVWKKVSVGLTAAALAGWFSVSLAGTAVSGGAAPVGVGALLGMVVGGYFGYRYREKIGNVLGLERGPLRTFASVAVGAVVGAAVGAVAGGIGVAVAGVMSAAVAFLAAGAVVGGIAGGVFGCIRTKRQKDLGPTYGLVTGAVAGTILGMAVGLGGIAGGVATFTALTALATAGAGAFFVGPWIYKHCEDLHTDKKAAGGENGAKAATSATSQTKSAHSVTPSPKAPATKKSVGSFVESLFSRDKNRGDKKRASGPDKTMIIGDKMRRLDSIGEAKFDRDRSGGGWGRGGRDRDEDCDDRSYGPHYDSD